MKRLFFALLTPLLALPSASAQTVQRGLRVPDGFEVVEYADSKLANDIFHMTIDPKGRVVVSGAGYIRVLVDENDCEIGRWILPSHHEAALIWNDYVPQETLFWRRRIWDKVGGHIGEDLHFCMDWDLLIRLSGRHPAVLINEFLAVSREYPATKTQQGGVGRVAEIAAMIQRHTRQEVTPGTLFYLLETLKDITRTKGLHFLQEPLGEGLAALGDTLFITRLPATYNECGRLIAEAVAHNAWEAVGVLAHTKPTKHRPATSYRVSEGEVTLYGTAYRAGVVHSSGQDKRRQQRLARDIQASQSTMQATVRTAEQHEYFCRADADAAAAQLRAVHTPYHLVDVTVEERPVSGRGRWLLRAHHPGLHVPLRRPA